MEPMNITLKKIILSITKDQLDDIEKNIYEAKLHEDWDRVTEQLKRLDIVEEALNEEFPITLTDLLEEK